MAFDVSAGARGHRPGIAFICGAVTVLPVMDAISKSRTGGYGPAQIAAVCFGCRLPLLGPVTPRHSGRAALCTRRDGAWCSCVGYR